MIYEIINIGKGLIESILPENLLLINDSTSNVQALQNILDNGNTTTSAFYSEIDTGNGIVQSGVIDTPSTVKLVGTKLDFGGEKTTTLIGAVESGGFMVIKEGTTNKTITYILHDNNNSNIYTLATLGDIVDSRPYKVYTSLVSQSGTSAPTAIVLENTFDSVPTYQYLGDGVFQVICPEEFIENKIALLYGSKDGVRINMTKTPTNNSNVLFTSSDNAGTKMNSLLSNETIEIRCYT